MDIRTYLRQLQEKHSTAVANLKKVTLEELHQHKQLVLILDLDGTLIHATPDASVGESACAHPQLAKDIHKIGAPIPSKSTDFYVKLRPGVREFLDRMTVGGGKFKLAIFTMGARGYADDVARILDPEGNLFEVK